MDRMRFLLALWVGKLLIIVCRLGKRGGSSLPGRLARRIHPAILTRLAQQAAWGSIVISGTNGKTTTALLLANMITAAGFEVVHNRTGANLIYGVTSTFIAHSTLFGKLHPQVNVLECDEAALERIAAEVQPRAALVTNFFRDQLDRFGELEHTVNMVERGLKHMRDDGFVVLNADDPAVAALAHCSEATPVFYGMEDIAAGQSHTSDAAETRWCSRCGGRFAYEVFYLAHLGLYYCAQCGMSRPQPEVKLLQRQTAGPNGAQLVLGYQGLEFNAFLPIPGLYNVYNALAATACALSMGIGAETVASSLGQSTASFGRMERLQVADGEICLILIKNPAGCNEVLRTILEGSDQLHLLIAINDKLADGTDVSWLWDADFEMLGEATARIAFCQTSGSRAEDMAVRLKYAGVSSSQAGPEPSLHAALHQALKVVPSGETLYILPTYTAMLELRRLLNQMGYGRRFWEA